MLDVDGLPEAVVPVDDSIGKCLAYRDLGKICDLDLLSIWERQWRDVAASPDKLHDLFEGQDEWAVDSGHGRRFSAGSLSVLLEQSGVFAWSRRTEEHLTGPEEVAVFVDDAERPE